MFNAYSTNPKTPSPWSQLAIFLGLLGGAYILAILAGGMILLSKTGLNRGAMPQEMFREQIRRFARDVLPALQAHQVTRPASAESAPA